MRKILNNRPIVFLTAFFIFGILVAVLSIRFSYIIAIVFGSLFLVATIIIFVLYKVKKFNLKSLSHNMVLFLIFAVFGFFLMLINLSSYYSKVEVEFYKGEIIARIDGLSVSYSEDKYSCVLSDIRLSDGRTLKNKGEVVLYNITDDIEVGGIIRFDGTLSSIDVLVEDGINVSKYKQGIYYSLSTYGEFFLEEGNRTFSENIRYDIEKNLENNLSKDNVMISKGLLFGDVYGMDSGTKEMFQTIGVSHIFAVSGLHMGFLMLIIAFVLRKLRCNRYVVAVVSTFAMGFYSYLCGFSPSSLRSVIMGSIYLFAGASGKKKDSLSIISFACFLMLLFNPINLFDIGFQLSFLCVTGIALFAPLITRKLKFLPDKIAQSLGTVFSVQIVAAPAIIYYFSYLSLIGIIANLIFMPLVFITFVTLFVFSFCSLIIGAFAVFLKIGGIFLNIVVSISRLLFNLSFLNFDISIPFIAMILLLVIAFLISPVILRGKKWKAITTFAIIPLLTFSLIYPNVCVTKNVFSSILYSLPDNVYFKDASGKSYLFIYNINIADDEVYLSDKLNTTLNNSTVIILDDSEDVINNADFLSKKFSFKKLYVNSLKLKKGDERILKQNYDVTVFKDIIDIDGGLKAEIRFHNTFLGARILFNGCDILLSNAKTENRLELLMREFDSTEVIYGQYFLSELYDYYNPLFVFSKYNYGELENYYPLVKKGRLQFHINNGIIKIN